MLELSPRRAFTTAACPCPHEAARTRAAASSDAGAPKGQPATNNTSPDDRGGFPKRGVRRSATISLARSGFLDYGLCILDFGLTSPIYGWRPVSRRRPTGAACHTLRRRQKSITSIFLGSNSTKVDTRQLFTAESVSWWGPSVVPQLVGLFSPRLSHERRSGVGVNRMIM